MKTNNILTLSLCSSLLLAACGEKKSDRADASKTNGGTSAIEAVIVTKKPDDAKTITEIRKSVKAGQEVTLSGKVMGRMSPFVDGRALVLLGDPAVLTSCDLRPDDGCESPWDVCCDDPEAIKASVATIQIVDDSGKPVKAGIKGVAGIKELSELVVTGTVAEGSNADNLLVNATAIYVKP